MGSLFMNFEAHSSGSTPILDSPQVRKWELSVNWNGLLSYCANYVPVWNK